MSNNGMAALGSFTTPVSTYALEVNQSMLKEDDDLLRQTFLKTFKHHHPQLSNKVDVIFALSQVRRIAVALRWGRARGCLGVGARAR